MEQNVFLQKFYNQLGDVNLQLPAAIGPAVKLPPTMHYTHLRAGLSTPPAQQKPEQIDELVAMELQHLKTHYANEEQRYVDQMLLENPIVVERRAPTKPDSTTTALPLAPLSSRDVQRQRAESCRKSRYNNKIKKAKLRFRHKFVCNQLTESANVLDYIRDVIAQAETQLLARGFNRATLERMRQNFGVERCAAMAMDTSNSNILK